MESAPEIQSQFLNITDLAARLGRDKAAISRRAKRLIERWLLVWRRGPKGSKMINVEAFERLAAAYVNAVNEMNGLAAAAANSPVLSREQARKTAIAADLLQLEREQRIGNLLALAEAQRAVRDCAGRLRRGVEQMSSRAEEVASSLAKDSAFARSLLEALRSDPQGARAYFRSLARDQLAALARLASAFDVLSENHSTDDMMPEPLDGGALARVAAAADQAGAP
jgi:DNA-binding MarR family transcriptional regulator